MIEKIICLLIGLGITFFMYQCQHKFLELSPEEISCNNKCSPNRGIVEYNKCYCSTTYKEAK